MNWIDSPLDWFDRTNVCHLLIHTKFNFITHFKYLPSLLFIIFELFVEIRNLRLPSCKFKIHTLHIQILLGQQLKLHTWYHCGYWKLEVLHTEATTIVNLFNSVSSWILGRVFCHLEGMCSACKYKRKGLTWHHAKLHLH